VRDDVHLREQLVDQRRAAERRVHLPVALLAVVELLVRDQDHVHVERAEALDEPEELLVDPLVVGAAVP
jgi:hypothetical protein